MPNKNAVENAIRIPELDREEKHAYLVCKTYRPYEGGIYSSAHVELRHGGWCEFRMYQDFNARFEHNPEMRATKKAIQTQHDRIFTPAHIAQIIQKALDHHHKAA